ncbi:hypothetical protein C8J57DRAFT_1083101, partial [Mycena rebaudengoi]
LYLLPTLTSDVILPPQILDGAVYNPAGAPPDLPPNTPAHLAACSGVSNATLGKILPPVMSAWVSTRRSASIKFGRVEIRAKLPTGDWLRPALWMLFVDDVYGGWPLSSKWLFRCVFFSLCRRVRRINYVRSSLNWGPTTFLNAASKTYGAWPWCCGRFDGRFHMYVLEFMQMYVDSRLHHMMELKSNKPFWDRGDFSNVVQNRTESIIPENPWVNGTKAAPFDQLVWFSLLGLSFLDNYYNYHVHIHPPIHPSTPDHYPLPL